MSEVVESVKKLCQPYAKALGVMVADVEYKRQSDGMHLVVYIDKPGGVSIEDCAALHEAIDAPLDELDPTKGASYILNVSSLGLDRNLHTDALLATVIGSQIDVSLFAKIDGKKCFDGATLVSFDSQSVKLLFAGKNIELPRKTISKITKHIIF